MKKITYLLVLIVAIVFLSLNVKAQYSVLDTIEWSKPTLVKDRAKRLSKRYGVEFTSRYKNYLFVPHLGLNNLNMTPAELYLTDDKIVSDSVFVSLKKNPTLENLNLGKDYTQTIFIYDDSLNCYQIAYYSYISKLPDSMYDIFRYYITLNADLLFHLWGRDLGEYFVLLENKVYMLKYDDKTRTCELVGF